jgi:hypothetical protein
MDRAINGFVVVDISVSLLMGRLEAGMHCAVIAGQVICNRDGVKTYTSARLMPSLQPRGRAPSTENIRKRDGLTRSYPNRDGAV